MKRIAIAIALLASCAQQAQAGELKLDLGDSGGKPLEDAVVWLKPASGPTPPPPARPAHAVIDQVIRSFKPLVSVMRTGTAVDFPNSDNIRHSVYSFSPARTFTLKLYSGKPSEPVVFDKEGFVTLGCNIHDQMIAWVVVVDSPWFAQSNASGSAQFTTVPEGDYELSAWHPGIRDNVPATRKLRIGTSPTTLALRLDAQPIATLLPDSEGRVHGSKGH
jgi:plastocyanin